MKTKSSKLKAQNCGIYYNIAKRYISFAFCVLIFAFGCFFVKADALDNPEAKLAGVIEDYVESAYPQWIGLQIRINFKFASKLFDSLRDISDDVQFTIVDVYQDFRPVGNVIFPIEVIGDGVNRKIFVRAKVEVFKPVVVAKKKIKRGAFISLDDLGLEERDVAMLPEKYYNNKVLVANTEAKTTIPENSTIFKWMVKEIPLVHRGDIVAIVVKGVNLMLKTEGTVLGDGYLGKEVKVRRKGSKKTLEGLLVSSKEVEVRLK